MSIQAQTAQETDLIVVNGLRIRAAQKMTLASVSVSHIAFMLRKNTAGTVAAASGNVTFTIRSASTSDAILASTVWGDVSALSGTSKWEVAQLASPVTVSGTVRVCCEFGSGNYAATSDYSGLVFRYKNSDVTANENLSYRPSATSAWTDDAATDAAYYFNYTSVPVLSVSTQAPTEVAGSVAVGNGRIDVFGTDGSATQHGHCWSTVANPTTTDSKTQNGSTAVLGAFTSAITGLTPAVTYHTRAYATDSVNTYYGVDVSFVGGQAVTTGTRRLRQISIAASTFYFVGDDGVEYAVAGTAV